MKINKIDVKTGEIIESVVFVDGSKVRHEIETEEVIINADGFTYIDGVKQIKANDL